MKRSLLGLAIAASLAAGVAQADTLIRPRVTLGYDSYEIKTNYYSSGAATSEYMSAGLGLTFAFGEGWYADAAYKTSMDATHDGDVPTYTTTEQDLTRTDTTLTIGKRLNESFSIFGGYKAGKSTLAAPPGAFTWSEDRFEASGPFIGGAAFFKLGSSIGMNVSAAYASMSGNWSDDNGFSADASTDGFSFGVGMNIPVTDKSGVAVNLSSQEYTYTGSSISDFKESVTSLSASYYMSF